MRHGKKICHLGHKAGHRKAVLTNLAKSLILCKRITTTLAKAKALRPFVEPILTKAKDDTMQAHRYVFSRLHDKEPVKALFNELLPRIKERQGGYTRIIRLPRRPGDAAEMALIELVDYNQLYSKQISPEAVTQ